MSAEIQVTECNYHIGDNPTAYLGATYVGTKLSLPMTLTWRDEQADEVFFVFKTQSVETWADWQKHQIYINGSKIGGMSDPQNYQQGDESFEIRMRDVTFLSLIKDKNKFLLEIELGMQEPHERMSDDFLLKGIYTKNMSLTVG